MENFFPDIDDDSMHRERRKAQDLRRSAWWKNRRSSGLCHYCNKIFPPRNLTMDHVVPLIRGGKSSKSNVVPSCRECNAQKKNLLPSEWQDFLDALAKREPTP